MRSLALVFAKETLHMEVRVVTWVCDTLARKQNTRRMVKSGAKVVGSPVTQLGNQEHV